MEKLTISETSHKPVKKRESLNLAKKTFQEAMSQAKEIQPTDKQPLKKVADSMKIAAGFKTEERPPERVNKQIKQLQATTEKFSGKIGDLDNFPEDTGLSRIFVNVVQSTVKTFATSKDGALERYGEQDSKQYKQQRHTKEKSLEEMNAVLTQMMTDLDSWPYITQATDTHLELLNDDSKTTTSKLKTVQEQREKAITTYKEVLKGYEDGKVQINDYKKFKDIADWFRKPREIWDKEVKTIVSKLKESNTRTHDIALGESTEDEQMRYWINPEAEKSEKAEKDDDGNSLLTQRERYKNLYGAEKEKKGTIYLGEQLVKLELDGLSNHLDKLRQDGQGLLTIDMSILKTIKIEGADKLADQWEKITDLYNNLQKKVSSDEMATCSAKYFENYGECLNKLHKVYKSKKAENDLFQDYQTQKEEISKVCQTQKEKISQDYQTQKEKLEKAYETQKEKISQKYESKKSVFYDPNKLEEDSQLESSYEAAKEKLSKQHEAAQENLSKQYKEEQENLSKQEQDRQAELSKQYNSEKAEHAKDRQVEGQLAENRTQKAHLELEMLNLKITAKQVFDEVNPVKEKWEKMAEEYHDKFNQDYRKLGTLIPQLEPGEERSNTITKAEALVSRWENTYHPAHGKFLDTMRKAVGAETSKDRRQQREQADKEGRQVFSQLKDQYTELRKLLTQLGKAHPELQQGDSDQL